MPRKASHRSSGSNSSHSEGNRIWNSSKGITRNLAEEVEDPDIEQQQQQQPSSHQQKRVEIVEPATGLTSPKDGESGVTGNDDQHELSSTQVFNPTQQKASVKKQTQQQKKKGANSTRKFGAGFLPMSTSGGKKTKSSSQSHHPLDLSDDELDRFSPVLPHNEEDNNSEEDEEGRGIVATTLHKNLKSRMVTLTTHHAKKGLPNLPVQVKRATTPITPEMGIASALHDPYGGRPSSVLSASSTGGALPMQFTMQRSLGNGLPPHRASTPAGTTTNSHHHHMVVPTPIHTLEGVREEIKPQIANWPAMERPTQNSLSVQGTSGALLPTAQVNPAAVEAEREREELTERLDERRREIAKAKGLQSFASTFNRPSTRGSTDSGGAVVSTSRALTPMNNQNSAAAAANTTISNIADPPALQEILAFRDSELRLIRPKDLSAKVRVYKEVLMMMIDRFTTFGPILKDIQTAYDDRIEQCESQMQQFLLGDKNVQLEKEKYLSLQSDAIASMEREKEETSRHRKAVVGTEQKLYHAEQDLAKIKDEYEMQLKDLRKELIMERAVRRDEAENKATYARMHHDLKDQWEEGSKELVEFKQSIRVKMYDLEQSEAKARSELSDVKEQTRRQLADAKEKYEKLAGSTVSPDEYSKMASRSKKLLESLRVLEKKVGWLQADLDAKASYEVAIPWKDIGSEYETLKKQGRSSEGIVRIILQKLSRAHKYEKQFFILLNGLMRMRDYLSSSDYARLSSISMYEKKASEIQEARDRANLQNRLKTSSGKFFSSSSAVGPVNSSSTTGGSPLIPIAHSFSKASNTFSLSKGKPSSQKNAIRAPGEAVPDQPTGKAAHLIVALSNKQSSTAVTPEFSTGAKEWKVPKEVKILRLSLELDGYWAPKNWTNRPQADSKGKAGGGNTNTLGATLFSSEEKEKGDEKGRAQLLSSGGKEEFSSSSDYTNDPDFCPNLGLDYELVKSLCVSAFAVCSSQGISLSSALESVARSHYDFTSQGTFFSNFYTAASEWFPGDPFISLFLTFLRGDRLKEMDSLQKWYDEADHRSGSRDSPQPEANSPGGGVATRITTSGFEMSGAGATSAGQMISENAGSSSGGEGGQQPQPVSGTDEELQLKRERERRVATSAATCRVYSQHFLNQLRLLYTCFEKTEKLLTGGSSKSTGTLPRKVIYECLAQCLPHKTTKQMVRLQHIIHCMSPHASLVKNTFYRDLFGHFSIGKASPLLVELADQFLDEVMLFRHIVVAAVQAAAREETEGRLTPMTVTNALKAYLIHPNTLQARRESELEALGIQSLGGSSVNTNMKGKGGKKVSTAGILTSPVSSATGEDQQHQANNNVESLLSPQASVTLPHALLDNLSVVEHEVPTKLVERWVAYCYGSGELHLIDSVAPADPDLVELDSTLNTLTNSANKDTGVRSAGASRRGSTFGGPAGSTTTRSNSDGTGTGGGLLSQLPPKNVHLFDILELPRCPMMEDLGSRTGGGMLLASQPTAARFGANNSNNTGDLNSALGSLYGSSVQPALSVGKAKAEESGADGTTTRGGASSTSGGRKSVVVTGGSGKDGGLEKPLSIEIPVDERTGSRAGSILRQSLLSFSAPGFGALVDESVAPPAWYSEYLKKKEQEEAVDRHVHEFVTHNNSLLVDCSEFVETLLLYVPLIPIPHVVVPSVEEAKEIALNAYNSSFANPTSPTDLTTPTAASGGNSGSPNGGLTSKASRRKSMAAAKLPQ